MQVGIAAVAGVLVAGLLAVGITYAVNLQAQTDRTVQCAVSIC